jgi:spermidine synthase
VIVNIGDPYTAQLDRFYTEEFFKEARRILKRGGVLSFALSSSENYINDELRRFLKTVHATLKKVFPDVKVIPGNTAYFLASDGTVPLTYDYRVLMERAGARSLDVKYVREYYLFSKLSPERTAYLEGVLTSGAHGEINRDFRPLGYYYYTLFWMSHFKDSVLKKMLKAVTEKKIWFGIAAIILLVLVGGSLYARPTVLAIAMTGFSSMALQMVMLLSFQMIYGYLFYKLGAILTAFMAGLALGGAAAVGVTGLAAARRIFTLTQAGITAYAACLPAAFSWLASSRSAFTAWAGPNIIFMALPAIAALLVGFQFPLAGSIYLEGRAGAGRAGGTNYGSDLFGASLGALLTGTVLIPVLGIASTCLAAAAMNLAVTLLLLKRL